MSKRFNVSACELKVKKYRQDIEDINKELEIELQQLQSNFDHVFKRDLIQYSSDPSDDPSRFMTTIGKMIVHYRLETDYEDNIDVQVEKVPEWFLGDMGALYVFDDLDYDDGSDVNSYGGWTEEKTVYAQAQVFNINDAEFHEEHLPEEVYTTSDTDIDSTVFKGRYEHVGTFKVYCTSDLNKPNGTNEIAFIRQNSDSWYYDVMFNIEGDASWIIDGYFQNFVKSLLYMNKYDLIVERYQLKK